MDDDPERPAGTDGDSRLDVQVLLGDALAGPVDVPLGGFADRPDQIALVAAQSQFRADAKQGGERDALDEPPGVVVDLVLEPGIVCDRREDGRRSEDREEARCLRPARWSRDGEQGIIEHNVAHGIRKLKDQVRDQRLSEDEYRILGKMLREASEDPELTPTIVITRLLALTGCRRGEILGLKWSEVDFENSCLRLADLKEGASTRPVGLPVIELLEERRKAVEGEFVFPGVRGSETFGSFPNQWNRIFDGDKLPGFTAHILRHSFASTANDLGFTESTIAALVGHSDRLRANISTRSTAF